VNSQLLLPALHLKGTVSNEPHTILLPRLSFFLTKDKSTAALESTTVRHVHARLPPSDHQSYSSRHGRSQSHSGPGDLYSEWINHRTSMRSIYMELTVQKCFLNLLPCGHHEGAVLHDFLVERLSRNLRMLVREVPLTRE
jgi:hypothetical protein